MAGASKRGYSTWHVAAVDPRVIAIVPIVMDELNFADNVQHHYRSLGGACLVLISLSLQRLVFCFGGLLAHEPHNAVQRTRNAGKMGRFQKKSSNTMVNHCLIKFGL